MTNHDVEVWLRGPVEGVPTALQPIAHSLLQAREEIRSLAAELPEALLWTRPGGVASAGFHLQHLRGVLDRLLTYARGEPVDDAQLAALGAEGTAPERGGSVRELCDAFDAQVDRALAQLRATDARSLGEPRHVGRARLPSTVLGLLVHAAEHTHRHLGQLLVTARVQQGAAPDDAR